MNTKSPKLHAVTTASAPTGGVALSTLRTCLTESFLERTDVIDALLTACVAGEHTFILGPPGTAKSALVRAVSQSFGLRYWEVLMTRFSTPEDLFGPVKLSALQADSFERAIDRYLPTADVAFLDEVWKANGGILNALLTLLNERVFHNGGSPVKCPLVSAIGASNELPEGPELEALYDRFLVRLHVDYLSDRGSFVAMLGAPEPAIPRLASDIRAEQKTASAVTCGPEIFEAMADTRTAAQKAGLRVSDRRWRKCLSLVRAAAHLDGRSDAAPDDLGILEHSLWSAPSERSQVARLVQGVVNPNAARAVECLDAAKEARAKLPTNPGKGDLTALAECNASLTEIRRKLDGLGAGRKIDGIKAQVDALASEASHLAARAIGVSLPGRK